ncbi:MAG: HisA/HisF-related TIM barrel protein [Hyphomicrobium sp.]|nr:HisA/HisF-related TIM barrel protein [Hyphomicrobium sp.]
MDIIPVIDLKGGLVVRAVAGDRARYRPLDTPLAPGRQDAAAIAEGYRALFPFASLYVADLDAIGGAGDNRASMAALQDVWPGDVWLDAGLAVTRDLAPRIVPVVGSESLLVEGLCALVDLAAPQGRTDVLSLDFRGESFIGPAELLATPVLWPERVIVMSLTHVGTDGGPDLARVRQIAAAAGFDRRVYAAGGVRHRDDVRALRDAGAAGALVATAMHSGALSRRDLDAIAQW